MIIILGLFAMAFLLNGFLSDGPSEKRAYAEVKKNCPMWKRVGYLENNRSVSVYEINGYFYSAENYNPQTNTYEKCHKATWIVSDNYKIYDNDLYTATIIMHDDRHEVKNVILKNKTKMWSRKYFRQEWGWVTYE